MDIAADTRCNVCNESPADTLYMEQPMCYPCRTNAAVESWAVDNLKDIATDTRCNVCEESPAETIYMDRPMCFICRNNLTPVGCFCDGDKACDYCIDDGIYTEGQ